LKKKRFFLNHIYGYNLILNVVVSYKKTVSFINPQTVNTTTLTKHSNEGDKCINKKVPNMALFY